MLIFLVIGVSLVLLLAAIAMEVERHRQNKASKVLLALAEEDRRLLEVSRTNDYREAVIILKRLRLIDETGLARLNGNIWNFNPACLFRALGKFWHLRWPKLSAAKRAEEISRLADDFALELNDDFDRLRNFLAIIRRHHPDVAKFLGDEIFS